MIEAARTEHDESKHSAACGGSRPRALNHVSRLSDVLDTQE